MWSRRHCRKKPLKSIIWPEIGCRPAGFINLTVDNTKDVFPVVPDVRSAPCCGEGRYWSEEQVGCGKTKCCCVGERTSQRETKSS